MDRELHLKLTIRLYTDDNRRCFGPGIATLLERVREHRSLRAAASSMEMAYSKAWRIIRTAEEVFGCKMLDSTTGGRHGGGAAYDLGGEGDLRESGEAEPADTDRLLEHAQRMERNHQVEERGEGRQLGGVVVARHGGSRRGQHEVEEERCDDVVAEDAEVIGLVGGRLAHEHLRKAAVGHHERHRGEGEQQGDDLQVFGQQQTQHEDAYDELEEGRGDLFAHCPPRARGDLLFQAAFHRAAASSRSRSASTPSR